MAKSQLSVFKPLTITISTSRCHHNHYYHHLTSKGIKQRKSPKKDSKINKRKGYGRIHIIQKELLTY